MEESFTFRSQNYQKQLRLLQQDPIAFDLRFAFYLFVASIPLEVYAIFQNVSIPKILAAVFLIIIAVRGKLILRMPEIPFWFFLCYLSMIALSIQWLNPFFFGYWRMRLIQLIQLLLTFWICSILMSYKRIVQGAMAFYSYTVLFSIVLVNLKVPGFVAQEAVKIYGERATVGLSDPNSFTFNLGVSLIYFVERMINYFIFRKKISLTYLIIIVYLLVNVTMAGSRGGQIGILIGLVTFILTGDYGFKRGQMVAIILTVLILFVVSVFTNQEMKERWEETFTEGRASGRETVWPEAINMIKREPVLGYGPGEHVYILGPPTGKERRDPHSTFIWVIHEVGLVGGIPFIIGFLYCGVIAYKKRKGSLGSIPISLFLLALVANNDYTALYDKTTWFVLAIAASREIQKH